MKDFLKVVLWGKEIGRLAWHDKRNVAYFNYNPEFLSGALDVAPLVASIHNPASYRTIFGESERIYQKLPSFISDSLPDAWGNQLFEQWRKKLRISDRSVTPLQKLAFIGKRGMGALEFIPEIDRKISPDNIDIKALADLADKIQRDRENIRIMPDEELTLHSLISVGTSAGGRLPKGIIAMNPATGEIRSGQVDMEPGFEYYILKFGDSLRSLAEIEQTYYEMATMAGISMMPSRLMEVEGVNHFLTKRFDRDNNGKLHTQTLAALYPDADSYEKMLTVCRKLNVPETDCQEIFRRLVFNILANNTDDHHKNFTFIMNREGLWRLSPAYDMTFIFDSGGYLPNEEHCLMIGGKLKNITYEDILGFAEECGIRDAENIIKEVVFALKSFRELAQKNGVKEEWMGRIETCINAHLSSWGFSANLQSYSFEVDGHMVKDAQIHSAYKGNFHLLASIDGRIVKYILRKNLPDHIQIVEKGLSNLTLEDLQSLVAKYLIPKVS
ncbi:MAG: type II toxin-antitoxin system HipA family toxin [Muribaculaceae bacterium]|nr:type II toxin-antitoxin system HipA family toxin [Muribaculaceae bacterium]